MVRADVQPQRRARCRPRRRPARPEAAQPGGHARSPGSSDDDARSSPSTSAPRASAPPSSTATWPSGPWRGGRSRRRRRSPGSSSSMPPSWPASCSTPPPKPSPPPASRSAPSASPTSGPAPSCGTAAPASRSPRPSAGRTCARSASAWSCGPSTTSRWPPTSRPPSWPWILANTPGARDRDLALRHRRHLAGVAALRRRGPRHRPVERRHHRVPRPRRGVVERARPRRCSTCRRACCRASSTRAASSAPASALPGAPPIAALVGDQQGSLVGQGCVTPGRAKITFGTGGILDVCRGAGSPASARRAEHGSYPGRRLVASAAR